jgi:hypothetical protein
MVAKSTTKLSASAAEIERELFFHNMNRDIAPAWRPEPGTTMVGTLNGLRMGRDGGYGEYPILIYTLDDGSVVSLHAFHTILRDQLREMKPKTGDRHLVHYIGKLETNASVKKSDDTDRTYYHMYYVKNAADLDTDDGMLESYEF